MANKKTVTGVDRRGEWVAVLGAVLSLLFAILLGTLAIIGESSGASIWIIAFQFLGTTGIWLLCLIQLHQQRLFAEERLEVAELERMRREKLGGAETIFDEEDLDQMDALSMGRRLRTIQRFLIPVLAILVAAFHFAAGLSMFKFAWLFWPLRDAELIKTVEHAQIILFFTGGCAFVSFMLSRYALGMSRIQQWAPLRAGGNFMFGASACTLLVTIGLLFVLSGFDKADDYVSGFIGLLLAVLAIETILNFILDFYRPRVEGEIHRPFYDSRILGMFSEPGGIVQSVAKAIDYQFGFKVSETWFYGLLRRQIPYLLLVQATMILLLTCFVVVPPGHQAVVTHFGDTDGTTMKAGIHVTWPWPIDSATVVPVERIQRMVLGFAKTEEDEETHKSQNMEQRPPVLWTKKHYNKEYTLLVADRLASADSKVPVNLLSATMPVQWRIKHDSDADVIRYQMQSNDIAEIIESLAYRELTHYAASADINDLLGMGGIEAAGMLQQRLQSACDHAGTDGKGLGVEIVFVGLGGIHPPQDEGVAQAYQDVVSAIETKDAKIKAAEGDAARMRILAAGMEWEQIYKAISDENGAATEADRTAKAASVGNLLRTVAGGRAREIAAVAERDAYGRLFAEKSSAERYALQLKVYAEAPSTYALRLYLRMVSRSMKEIRKYVIAMHDASKVIYEVDLKPPAAVDILGADVAAMENKK